MSNGSGDMIKNWTFQLTDFLYMTHVHTINKKNVEFLTILPELLNTQGSTIPHFNPQKILV